MDWRVIVVLGPILLAVGWAGFNIYKSVVSGETKLFGDRGNAPWNE